MSRLGAGSQPAETATTALASMGRHVAELTSLMSRVPAGIMFSKQGRVARVSQSLSDMLGYAADELNGLAIAPGLVKEESFAVIAGGQSGNHSQPGPFRTELQMHRKDGSGIWCRVEGHPIDDPHANNDTVWFIEDVSEDVIMRDALDRSARELVAIFDAVQIGIVVIRGAQVARCNRFAETMLGYASGTLAGTPTKRFMEIDTINENGAIAIAIDDDGSVADGFARFGDRRLRRRDDSLFWGRLTGRPLDHRFPAQASVWIIEDVTERHEAEQALIVARNELERRVRERTVELVESNTRLLAEMTERKQSEQRVWHMAHHDALTGLPNRLLLQEHLTLSLANAARSQHRLAVLFVDLDRFKGINDSLGHAVGDALLKEIAERLQASVRGVDTVARLGGDEFVVILYKIEAREQMQQVANKIMESLARPVHVSGHELMVTASIGISVFPEDGVDADRLVRNADTAMYKAKARGRNAAQFFMTWMNDEATRSFTLEHRLRNAIEREQLEVHYQPQVEFNPQEGAWEVCGIEALLRWNDPDQGSVPPVEFIPIAEDSGIIIPVGEWVLHQAMRQNRRWQDEGRPALPMSVNLSPRQFRDKDLVATITSILRDTHQLPTMLELEITESTLIHDVDEVLAKLTELASLGIRLAIDDFGTGYSSMAYLKRFPVKKLKVDRSFVRDACVDSDAAAIVSAMIGLGRTMGMDVLAEGVETIEQLALLRAYGCSKFQGYYFAQALQVQDSDAIFLPPVMNTFQARS